MTRSDRIDGMAQQEDTLVLLLSDHLRWDMEQAAHLKLLQDKFNTYIRYFESGAYKDSFDGRTFDKCLIDVCFLHEPHESYEKLLSLVKDKLEERHITIKSTVKKDAIK